MTRGPSTPPLPRQHKVRDRQGGGTAVQVVGRRGTARHLSERKRTGQDMQPPRPKYHSPPSCRKKRWVEFTVQSLPSLSSSLKAAMAAVVPPLYLPRRSRGDCRRRHCGNCDCCRRPPPPLSPGLLSPLPPPPPLRPCRHPPPRARNPIPRHRCCCPCRPRRCRSHR